MASLEVELGGNVLLLRELGVVEVIAACSK